jgi:uncharacterized protein YndB with AHSA1/START domain
MPIKKEPNGRRSIQVEVEVPGTPEEVWRAIGTGAGISSWFVPTTMEEREGGTMVCAFGPGPELHSRATMTTWNPPHYFAAESPLGPHAPTMATEWFVEAKSGGSCIVRVVHSLFADTDDWDNQLTGTESGWPTFFAILKLVLSHYRDQRVHAIHELSFPAIPPDEGWATLAAAVGLSGAKVGDKRTATPAVPPMSGTVVLVRQPHNNQMLVHLDQPAPGVAMFYAEPCGGPVMVSVNFYLFGDRAEEIVTRDAPKWRAWMAAHFPSPAASTAGGTT